MKIIYCIHSVYNPGGMERVLLNKISWLCDNTDWEIKVVTTDQHNRPPFYKFPERVSFTDLEINYSDDNESSPWRKIAAYLKKRKIHKQRLTSYLLSENADIVISLFPSESSFIPQIKDGSRKILELHFNRYFRLQYGRMGIIGFIDRLRTLVDYSLANSFHNFVVLTEEDRKNWGKLKNIKVIPNAVHTIPDRVSSLDNKRVIAVGRLDYQKGFDKLIDAWGVMMNKYPCLNDWHLDIFGQGEWREMLLEKIQVLNLSNSVTINKPTDKITEEYLNSSLLVMSSNYEGFGMVLVEAMACGVPCVSFSCPCGPSDIIKNKVNGLLVNSGNINLLADAMATLMSDEELRHTMGREAVKVTDTYSEEAVMKMWTNLFEEVLN